MLEEGSSNIDKSNVVIQSLWIGGELSPLELLTLKSFLYHGHEFHLYVYYPIETELPQGVILKDAREILPEDAIFTYKYGNKKGLGKGSFAGFADIFRFKLLYDKGGWWVDMDVTCMKPFSILSAYFFRSHDYHLATNSIIKCPPNSRLMYNCYLRAKDKVNQENRYWTLPSAILSDEISKLNLTKYVVDKFCNPDRWELIALYREYAYPVSPNYYAIHWMNEEWKRRGWEKQELEFDQALDNLLIKKRILLKYNVKNRLGRVYGYYLMVRLGFVQIYNKVKNKA